MTWTKKTILTDCDGVLLNWEYAFQIWMKSHGYDRIKNDAYCIAESYGLNKSKKKKYVKLFNESAAMGFLPALRDAAYYVKLLHEKHGFRFEVITSMSLDPHAIKLREMNLKKIFGNAICNVICLDTGADKDEILAERCWRGTYWVEDKIENAQIGAKLGLKTFLMQHEFNMNEENLGDIIEVKNWEQISNYVVDRQRLYNLASQRYK